MNVPQRPERVREKGFTLIEILVASSLALVVLLVLVQLFIPALRAWTDGQQRSEIGQNLLITTQWLGDDITRSAPGSARLTDEGVLVMKCALGQTVDDSNPFSEFVAYWRDDDILYRSVQTLASSDDPVPTATLAELAAVDNRRKIASGLTAFDVTIPREWRVQIHIAMKKLERSGEIQTAFTSIYAPFDISTAELDAQLAEEEGGS